MGMSWELHLIGCRGSDSVESFDDVQATVDDSVRSQGG